MGLKVRLRQHGRKNRKVYRVVVAPTTAAREGRYVEMLGWYNPHEADQAKQVSLNGDRLEYWLGQGVELTEKAAALANRSCPEVMKNHRAVQATRREKRLTKKAKGQENS